MSNHAYLGIFGPGPNSSAALISDNEIIAWAEEERFNRIKTAPNSYPGQAIRFCLEEAAKKNLKLAAVAYAWDCDHYAELATENLKQTIAEYPSDSDTISLQAQQGLNALYHPDVVKKNLAILLGKMDVDLGELPFHFFPHHLCHAASAFYCSGFDESLVITNDGVGEIDSSALYYIDGKGNIEQLASVQLPHTLGGFYASVTEFLGFRPYMDEGKTMGLAAYGKPNAEIENVFSEIIQVEEGEFSYTVNPRYRYSGSRNYGKKFTDLMVEKLGKPRAYGNSAMEAPYPDIAYAAQKKLEQALLEQVRYASKLGISDNICFAGGSHMNCKANGMLGETGLFTNWFFQPAASDNGVPLGAAMLARREFTQKEPFVSPLKHLYFGPSFTDEEIEAVLKRCKLTYRKSENIAKEAASLIADNKIVGWFQGRMEVGARALGGRSILANPLDPDARDHVNKHVKNREAWRPFCPSLKLEGFKRMFDTPIETSPYMIIACSIEETFGDVLPSCVHVDGTVRPQTVDKTINPLYWQMLDEFEKITGHPIVVNTSFNVQGEPIVMRPEEAVRCFFGSGMDALAIGSFIVEKE